MTTPGWNNPDDPVPCAGNALAPNRCDPSTVIVGGNYYQGKGDGEPGCNLQNLCCSGLACEWPVKLGGPSECSGIMECPPLAPNWQPLYTTQLLAIAVANNVNGVSGATVGQQRALTGLAFEAWALTEIGVLPPPPGHYKALLSSPARAFKTVGSPKSVVPEFVGDQASFSQSVFVEVKAVAGSLAPSYSKSQILGLLDVANTRPTPLPPAPPPPHRPPAVFFITTGNTSVPQSTIDQGTMWGVAVWQQYVLYDANDANPVNPHLTLASASCLSPQPLCAPNPLKGGWTPSTLGSPSTPPALLIVPNDPDPPTVDD